MTRTSDQENLSLIAPELPEILVRRYRLLRKIYYSAQ